MADVTTPFGFPYPEPTDLVRDGATDIEALAEGVNDQFAAGFQFAGQRIYTSSGQFVKADPFGTGDIGLRAIRVRMVGGGGGSGHTQGPTAAAAGGGGGGFAEAFISNIGALASTETVTVGAGGNAGANSGNNGGTGGTTSFASLAVATGGAGGAKALSNSADESDGGAGGIGTSGDLLIQGQGGGAGINNQAQGGAGGSSQLGGGAEGRGRTAQARGSQAGGLFGGGASGAACHVAVSLAGQNGAPGVVIVEVFV